LLLPSAVGLILVAGLVAAGLLGRKPCFRGVRCFFSLIGVLPLGFLGVFPVPRLNPGVVSPSFTSSAILEVDAAADWADGAFAPKEKEGADAAFG